MQITRRHLLALSAATAAAGALGTGGLVLHWWNQPATEPYSVLNDSEAAFVNAWSGVAFPATSSTSVGGHQAGLDRFLDGILQRMPPTTASLLRVLINGLNAASIPVHGRSFVDLSSDDQLDCFESWTHSNISGITC